MQKNITLFLVALSAIFWGTNFNIGKYVIEHISPLTTAAIRFFLASLFITPLIFCLESRATIKEAVKRNQWVYLFLGIVGVGGFNGFIAVGLQYTTAINASLIMATNPLVTTVLSAIFLKSMINGTQRAGLLISLAGVIAVITHGSLDMLLHLRIASGDWLIMAGNICWAVYSVFGRRFLNDSKPMITTTVTMLVGSLALILAASYDANISQLLNQPPQIYSSLLYMSLCGSVLAYLFWNYGITHLGAGTTSVFFNLVPVVTVLVAVIMGEPVTPIQIIGGLIVIFGVSLSTHVITLHGLQRLLKKASNDAVVDSL